MRHKLPKIGTSKDLSSGLSSLISLLTVGLNHLENTLQRGVSVRMQNLPLQEGKGVSRAEGTCRDTKRWNNPGTVFPVLVVADSIESCVVVWGCVSEPACASTLCAGAVVPRTTAAWPRRLVGQCRFVRET